MTTHSVRSISPPPSLELIQPHEAMPLLQPAEGKPFPWTNTPGCLNIIWVPMMFMDTFNGWMLAIATGDREGQIDSSLRLASMPLSIVHAISATLTLLVQLGSEIHASLTGILEPIIRAIPTLIFGLVICIIEGIYEIICVVRSIVLIENLSTETDQDLARSLEYLHANYFSLNQSEVERIEGIVRSKFDGDRWDEERLKMQESLLDVKRTNLERRVRPWCGGAVQASVNRLLGALRNPPDLDDGSYRAVYEANVLEARALVQMVKDQGKKELIIHIVGILTLAISAAGFILSMIACPALIPILLLAVGGAMSTISYFFGRGVLDHAGWDFDWRAAFPPAAWVVDALDCTENAPRSIEAELLARS